MDFIENFLSHLEQFRIRYDSESETPFGQLLLDNLQKTAPSRDTFVDMVLVLARNLESPDVNILAEFFEKSMQFLYPPADVSPSYNVDFDNFKFLLTELFLYLVCAFLKYKRFRFLGEFLHRDFLFYKPHSSKINNGKFSIFRHGINSFDSYYRETYSKNYVSPSAELLISRLNKNFTKEELISCDLLLHYISLFSSKEIREYWFPSMYIYTGGIRMDIIQRLISRKHFESVKSLFNVESCEELKEGISDINIDYSRYRYLNAFESIPSITSYISPKQICTTN